MNMYTSMCATGLTWKLTVHVPFMFVLNEGIAARFPRSLVVHYVDLEISKGKGEDNQFSDTQQDLRLNFVWWNYIHIIVFQITS